MGLGLGTPVVSFFLVYSGGLLIEAERKEEGYVHPRP